MNSLKGAGVCVVIAGIAFALTRVTDVSRLMFALSAGIVVLSLATYAASVRRRRRDGRIAGGPGGGRVRLSANGIPEGISVDPPRRRGWTQLKLVLLVTVLVGGATALYPMWRSGQPADGELTVRYRTDGAATATAAKPWLEVVNNSSSAVPLSEVTLRYYFTATDVSGYAFNCVQAHFGCSNVSGSIGALTAPGSAGGRYLQISFGPGAGSLAPGASTEGIELQLFRPDHKQLDQAADRSFNAESTAFAPSKLVTAYLRGVLVWGDEPTGAGAGAGAGAVAAAQGSTAPTAAPSAAALPAGVVFDNFHYSGFDDPALTAHGWQARTDQGGPGIKDTWQPSDVSFPSEASAQGGQVLQLKASTDGTKAGTRQSELLSTDTNIFKGTFAARIFLSDKPTTGRNGDHLNESFFAISSGDTSQHYSELDYEYMPNGGWGVKDPDLDTTSWYSAKPPDRVTHALRTHLGGWHTFMVTSMNGVSTYSMDGKELFSSNGKYFPREAMGAHFSAWFVDLPFTGPRSWDMRVNWFYYKADQAVSQADVQKAVDGFYATGTNYVNTVPKH
ncbi:cellulose binding domain-containing protein [Kitasatospora sp. McL0602]|uniref:cellulose binding domain-containing protein n=1 Tax=Kitasatospora sp. McL0602 TaxID=3439530 RepID=UPI003F89DAD6